MGDSNSYLSSGSTYRKGSAAGYGYSKGLSGILSYSIAMPKSYGTDIHFDSYLGRGKKGIAGYVDSLIKHSFTSLKNSYFYPIQKKEEPYKTKEMLKNYDLKMIKGCVSGKLGLMIPNVPIYDLPSMKRPVTKLETRLN